MSDFGEGGGWAEALGLDADPQLQDPAAPAQYDDPPQEEAPYYEEPTDEAVYQELSEVEQRLVKAQQRLVKAQLYRQFLVGSVFDGGGDPITAEVEQEFRAFARQQLQRLLGVPTQPRPDELSAEEIQVLKMIAATALSNARVKRAATPQPRPAQAPRPPQRQQAPAPAPRVPPRPQLRPRPLPEGVRPQSPPAPRRQPPPPQAAPRQQPRPAPRPQQPQPRRPPAPPQQPSREPPPLLADGEQYERNGRRYKVAWRQMSRPDEYGPRAGQILEKLEYGQDVQLPNGVHVLKTEGGELYKIVHQDLTPQVRTDGGVPFPTDNHQIESIIATNSNIALQRVDPRLRGLGDVVANQSS